MYRYVVRNPENKLTIFANDFTDIASIMRLWGDKKEWGNIDCPNIHNGESQFMKELLNQPIELTTYNV